MSSVDEKPVNGEAGQSDQQTSQDTLAEKDKQKSFEQADSENNNTTKNASTPTEADQDKTKPDKKFLHRPGVRLGPLLEKDIVPTQDEIKTYQDALAHLKDILNNQSAVKVIRLFEYGSMESGTSVKNHWSVKLLAQTEAGNPDDLSAQVEALTGVLKQKMGETYDEASKSIDQVKFSWKMEETILFGDIRLTTFPEVNLTDILTDKYSEEGATTFRRNLLTNEIQRLAFIKERPEAVKKLIRLLTFLYINEVIEKAAGDVGSDSQSGSPDLDVLELVCVWAWGVAGNPETFNLKKGLTKVLDLISRPKDIIIYWKTNYDPNTYLPHIECTTPFVMEAWNPYQNAAAGFDWESTSKMAENALNSRLLRSTPLEFDWQ